MDNRGMKTRRAALGGGLLLWALATPAAAASGVQPAATLPAWPAPAVVLFVAPDGDDSQPGSSEKPFASLEGARDAIRRLKAEGPLSAGGVEVRVRAGTYALRETLRLSTADSGTAAAPIRYVAAGEGVPRFSGGVRLLEFKRVSDPAVRARIPEGARGRVVEVDLAAAGVSDLISFELGGFSSGRGFRTHPTMELFVDGEPMTVARWPNEGFVKTGEVLGPLTLKAWDGKPGTVEGRFTYEGDRPAGWVGEPNAWLYGYWFWDWADSYERIEQIDVAKRVLTLAKPWHRYGYRKDQRFFAVNVLSELDAPGEWYLDTARRHVYLYPGRDLRQAVVELSTAAFPMLEMDGVSHVRFEGLLWELGGADGILIRGGAHAALVGCTIRKFAGNGLEIRGGAGHTVFSCNIHTLGRGGLVVSGGDRKTLSPAGHRIENCHIHHLSRIDHTYTPGVWLDGVGSRLAHNLIHDVASSAFRVGGNDHLIEFNEVHRVVLESDDQGGVDMWGNATYRGHVFRFNYWHHMGNWDRRGEEVPTGQAGIRLDDAISGVLIEGNVFHRCSAGAVGFGGVQIHGGKDNRIRGNLFVDCGAAVSFTAWGDARWRKFVANALEDPAIDRALYLERYPELARLAEDHDRNQIHQNTVVRCGRFILRDPGRLEVAGNRVEPEAKWFPEGADGRIRWDPKLAAELGLAHIPFERIGLQADSHRTRRSGEGWELSSDRF
jgi:hypothetical protein